MFPKYEEDFYAWTVHTAQLLKDRKMSEIDFENLIEEIKALGRSEKRQLVNHLVVLIARLLQWRCMPDFRGRIWEASIQEQRKRIKQLLLESPSLKSELDEFLIDAYEYAILLIKKETSIDLNLLPEESPYTVDGCLDDEFYPD